MRIVSLLVALVALAWTACAEPEPLPDPEWTPLLTDLDRVPLSAWGPSLDELWLAGGPLGSTGEGMILRHGPEGWTEVPTGTTDTFWWVFGTSANDIFFVGENGAIHHFDGVALEAMASPVSVTLFGVWGAGPNDVWAVGGDPFGVDETDVLLHYDGVEWARVTLADPQGVALFKVWGAASDDVWVVGQRGTILHYDGSGWSAVDSGVTATLFTVAGTASNDVFAVGGAPPVLLHYDGAAWTRLDNPGLASVLNGVAATADGSVLVVGSNGAKWRRAPDGEWFDEFDNPPYQDLHAAWLSPEGREGVVVGGNFNAPSSSMRVGVVAYWGAQPPVVP